MGNIDTFILHMLQDSVAGKFIALDNASGGYPYKVDTMAEGHYFKSKEDAERYSSFFASEKYIYREVRVTYSY